MYVMRWHLLTTFLMGYNESLVLKLEAGMLFQPLYCLHDLALSIKSWETFDLEIRVGKWIQCRIFPWLGLVVEFGALYPTSKV